MALIWICKLSYTNHVFHSIGIVGKNILLRLMIYLNKLHQIITDRSKCKCNNIQVGVSHQQPSRLEVGLPLKGSLSF